MYFTIPLLFDIQVDSNLCSGCVGGGVCVGGERGWGVGGGGGGVGHETCALPRLHKAQGHLAGSP